MALISSFLAGFEGQWRRPASDYKTAVKSYLIVLDTNVLLELYRFTPKARNELLDVLDRVQNRLWIPHQVAAEYYARRVDAVKEHLALYSSIPKSLTDLKNRALQELNTFAKRCSMSSSDRRRLTEPIEAAFANVSAQISKHGEMFDLSLEKVVNDDPVLAALSVILNGKTGDPFSPEECQSLIVEFNRRAEEKIPPGYKDAGKDENPHGDFFLWEQILREAKSRNSPILLVTNDAKEDWVRKEAGLTVGARPELIAEMKQRCQVDFLITQLAMFLKSAREELGADVSASTVAQAENVRVERRNTGLDEVRHFSNSEYDDLVFDLINNLSFWDARSTEAMNLRQSATLYEAQRGMDRATKLLDLVRRSVIRRDGVQVAIKLPSRDHWEEIERIRTRKHDDDHLQPSKGHRSMASAWTELTELEDALSDLQKRRAQTEAELQTVDQVLSEMSHPAVDTSSESVLDQLTAAREMHAAIIHRRDALDKDIRTMRNLISRKISNLRAAANVKEVPPA